MAGYRMIDRYTERRSEGGRMIDRHECTVIIAQLALDLT